MAAQDAAGHSVDPQSILGRWRYLIKSAPRYGKDLGRYIRRVIVGAEESSKRKGVDSGVVHLVEDLESMRLLVRERQLRPAWHGVPMSYNQNLWIAHLIESAAYLPS